MTRAEKLALARRLLQRAISEAFGCPASRTIAGACELTLDLIEDFTKPRGDAPQDGTESGRKDTPASPGAALSPAPAFDADALVNGVLNGLLEDGWSDMQVGMICSTLRAVAREMLKGGVK